MVTTYLLSHSYFLKTYLKQLYLMQNWNCFVLVSYKVLFPSCFTQKWSRIISLLALQIFILHVKIRSVLPLLTIRFEFLLLRIQALLKWVSDSARVAAMKRSGRMNYVCPSSSTIEYGLLMPSPSHLHCVAAILWHSYELLVEYDLPALLDQELFE